MEKVLWVKFGWSEFYRGGPVDGNFSHLLVRGHRGHEAYNFEPGGDDTYYCYVPPQGGKYAPSNDDQTGWTVICLAKHPKYKGIHIVGWYENASLLGCWREVPDTRAHLPVSDSDPSAGWKYCIASATAYFVTPDQRTKPFSHRSVRQSKYSFLAGPDVETNETKKKLLRKLKRRLRKLKPDAIANPTGARAPDPGAGPTELLAGFGTPEHRKKVEKAAENAVKRHYKSKGFKHKNVTKKKLGFDFVFTKGRKRRHVEVKGTSGTVPRFFLTRNENTYREHRQWRIAIVTNALDSNPKVRIYDKQRFEMEFNLEPYVFIGKPASMPGEL